MDDFSFEPKFGRAAMNDGLHDRKYLHAVIVETARGGPRWRARPRTFTGARIGRGGVAARMLGFERTGINGRRAIVKTRLVRMGPRAIAAARMHLDYIQRDGVSRDGAPGRLYCADQDGADGKLFLEPFAGDRHHFRLVVSPEDGAEYEELKPLIRQFMGRMEEDLGSELRWVAADHVDTLHPHTHIMLRGKDDQGADLVIAPAYIRAGMGERVADLVSVDLGPRSDAKIDQRLHAEINAERLTSIDRDLLCRMDGDRRVRAGGNAMADHAVRTGRLRKLGSLGLAEKLDGGMWRLAGKLEPVLCSLGRQEQAIGCMGQALAASGLKRSAAELVVHRFERSLGVTGRVVAFGASSDNADRRYLIVDGLDGRCHHLEIGRGDRPVAIEIGAIVHIEPRRPNRRALDEAHIASKTNNPSGRSTALRDVDHEGPAGTQGQHFDIEILSSVPLDALHHHDGETWLDKELVAPRELIRDARFGREVLEALQKRRAWLVEQDLAMLDKGRLRCRPNMLGVLRQRELSRAPNAIAGETGLEFRAVQSWELEAGAMPRLDLGPFALADGAKQSVFVPPQPAFQRSNDRSKVGISRTDDPIGLPLERARGLEV